MVSTPGLNFSSVLNSKMLNNPIGSITSRCSGNEPTLTPEEVSSRGGKLDPGVVIDTSD